MRVIGIDSKTAHIVTVAVIIAQWNVGRFPIGSFTSLPTAYPLAAVR